MAEYIEWANKRNTVRVLKGYRLTIPKIVRDKLKIRPGDEINIVALNDQTASITKSHGNSLNSGIPSENWV